MPSPLNSDKTRKDIVIALLVMTIAASVLSVFIATDLWPHSDFFNNSSISHSQLIILCFLILLGTGVFWSITREKIKHSSRAAFLLSIIGAAPLVFAGVWIQEMSKGTFSIQRVFVTSVFILFLIGAMEALHRTRDAQS